MTMNQQAMDPWHSMARLPIALIVDDPMPCVNPLYYFCMHVRQELNPPLAATIPVSLLEQFIEVIQANGVRGDFTVVPYPAGLGSIAEGLPGFDDTELQCWLELVRNHVTPAFDIHPELLTHTRALDLETRRMLDVSEHEWSSHQDEATLTVYLERAMSILKDVELPNHGITQPCGFAGDEDLYARAILAAEKSVNGRQRTHYFLDVLPDHPRPVPYCRLAKPETGEYVVSVPSAFSDAFWSANDGDTEAANMADYYLTSDGRRGRIVDRLNVGCPLIFHTHWQSLYGNGSLAGLEGLRILVSRIAQHLGDRVQWMKISEVSELVMACY